MDSSLGKRTDLVSGGPSAARAGLRSNAAALNPGEGGENAAACLLRAEGFTDIGHVPLAVRDLRRPNYALDNATSHTSKARRARAIWPEVTVMPWNHSQVGNGLVPERE